MEPSWLKLVLKAIIGNIEEPQKAPENKPVTEEAPKDVNLTGQENTANIKVVENNNGNVPIIQSNGSEADEMMGLGIERTTVSAPAQASEPVVKEDTTNSQPVFQTFVNIGEGASMPVEGNQPVVENPQSDKKFSLQEMKEKMANDIENIEFVDGKANIKLKNGETFTRPAFYGEPGYKKDGESVDERLARVFPDDYKNADTPEKKAKLVSRYFENFYNEVGYSDEVQKADYLKLLKNTNLENSEYAELLGQAVFGLRPSNIVKTAETAGNSIVGQEQKNAYFRGVANGLNKAIDKGGVFENDETNQTAMIGVIAEASQNSGLTDAIHIVSENTFRYCDESSCKIINIATATDDEIAKIKIYESMVKMGTIELSDEEMVAFNAMGATLKTKEAGAAAINSSLVIEDSEQQVQFVGNLYEQVNSQEAKEAMLETQGQNVANYHEESQLEVDAIAREHDTESQIYNIAASNHLHETAVANQTELVNRTTESGNEEALNNVATHAYEFDLNNRDSILQALQNCGYDSVMETLNNAKADYEKAEAANKKALEEQKRKNELAKQAASENSSDRQVEDNSRVSDKQNVSLSQQTIKAMDKAKEVKNLKGNKLEAAIKDLAENSTIPELKALALSGLRTDLIKYFMANPSVENMAKLASLRSELSLTEKKDFDAQISESSSVPLSNFFITEEEKLKK